MQLHNIQRKTKLKTQRQIGRGGKRGTTAGRGTKGQKARAGHKIRPEIRDRIKKLPKKRGYQLTGRLPDFQLIKIGIINDKFQPGEIVSLSSLFKKGLIKKPWPGGRPVKILADGNIDKKIIIAGCVMSQSAREKIIKAGGRIKE